MAFLILPDEGPVSLLYFDAIRIETHEIGSIVTRNPVERGAPITDHIQDEPDSLTFEGIITNSPLYPDGLKNRGVIADLLLDVKKDPAYLEFSLGGLIGAATNFFMDLFRAPEGPFIASGALQFPIPFDAILETQADLDAIKRAKTTCSVTTLSKSYSNLVLEHCTHTRDSFGHAIFACTFRQVVIVSSSTVDAPLPKEPRGSPAAAGGAAAGKTPPAQDFAELARKFKAEHPALAAAVGLGGF